jgi:hypothetical protein
MAATGYTPITLYGSQTAGNAPVAANLNNTTSGCEVAVNVADGLIYFKDPSGNVRSTGNYSPTQTLTDASSIVWNGLAGQVATYTFVSSNRTFAAVTNQRNGAFYSLCIIQNAGGNTITWNSTFKWAAGVAPTLSTAAGAKDFIVFRSDGTNMYEQGISQAVA